ncbi:flagellar brake protein [Thiohalobacter sp. COW1]|uniref:flagellar brake protein n=1 Tax=Thiohalobacter sp. COW1 TaxID=2795687 RepID=UPI001914E81B|nr:flagellar brake protein [Thiohalobacter sp. COW1]
MAKAEADQVVDLKLGVGDVLQVQFVSQEQRKYAAKVIGYLPNASLVITTPRIDGKVMLVREGQPLVVRMLSGNTCYGFNSRIIHNSMRPYPHLHLAYPDELERIVVRKAVRVQTQLPVIVSHPAPEDPTQSLDSRGTILDISTAGAFVASDSPLGGAGDLISMTARVPIAGAEKYLKMPAIIRSAKAAETAEGSGRYQYGVEFQLIEHMDTILLHGYVFEQMQNQDMQ